jgi:phosphomannomutase/phosphoglucomutase
MKGSRLAGIFRAYDIRGVYGNDLTPELALGIGKAFGTFLGGRGDVVVGHDVRLSCGVLKRSFVAGLLSTGCNCVDIGLVSTPVLYFASIHYGKRAGVMITASHNPPEYNGFKFCNGGISYSYDTALGELERILETKDFRLAPWSELGTISRQEVLEDYSNFLADKFRLEKKVKVVIDVGNGSCGFLKGIFEKVGCEVSMLYPGPDGRFPNHIPDPLREETLADLRKEVLRSKADLGMAFDGDGDRVGFIDEKGRVVRGDHAFILFARDVLRRRPGSKIIFNVLSSRALSEDVLSHGGIPIMSRVGHSYIHELLLEEKASLAGEVSGHFYFADDYYGFDDGAFAGLRMVEILSRSSLTLSQIVEGLPSYFTSPEIRVKCSDDRKFEIVNKLKGSFLARGYRIIDIDGVRIEFDEGWGLVRASNTEPALVLRFEATSEEKLSEIRRSIEDELKNYL